MPASQVRRLGGRVDRRPRPLYSGKGFVVALETELGAEAQRRLQGPKPSSAGEWWGGVGGSGTGVVPGGSSLSRSLGDGGRAWRGPCRWAAGSSTVPSGAKEAPGAHHTLDAAWLWPGNRPCRPREAEHHFGSARLHGSGFGGGLFHVLGNPSRWAVQGASSVGPSEARCPLSSLCRLWGLVLSPWARPAHP